MRKVRSSDAEAHLTQFLTEVERGETIVITRHDRAMRRLLEPAGRDVLIQKLSGTALLPEPCGIGEKPQFMLNNIGNC